MITVDRLKCCIDDGTCSLDFPHNCPCGIETHWPGLVKLFQDAFKGDSNVQAF